MCFDLGRSKRFNSDYHDFVEIPSYLKVEVEGNRKIIINGIDKQKVRSYAINKIRFLRKPSIYKKNKGIYCGREEETMRLKQKKLSRK